ncbi:uncharacterized protein LOC131661703 [Vicia villosa]|uniref:uncharacterized protein LOC131661703 n=1 Tax=Vicia villosa TaxID=3911 RepID=UPI00273AE25C|nr:uncharacterized protein LOC131661703 [Vicia villosa]
MAKKEKSRPNATEHEQLNETSDNLDGASTPSLVFISDDDDEEANQDLSLRIVEKARRNREAKLAPNDTVLNGVDSSLVSPSQQFEFKEIQSDAVLDEPSGIASWEVMEEKKTTKLIVDSGDSSVIIIDSDQEVEEIIKTSENHEIVDLEASPVQIGDNAVLRKLLRGPRYFDPPDSSWGACYNCGEEGHAAVNCTAAKRLKPCYVCGGLGHAAKQCTKTNCYICKKGGHRAKDCPEKHTTARVPKSLAVCLKCGNSGHDMFSCRNDYSPNDLKEIQCYLCKTFGHLCCVNTVDAIPGEISCYKCGQMGHTGLACSRSYGETTGAATPTLCYRCGEEGHFARECTSSIKAGKKNSESWNNKNRRPYKENDYMGHWSAPHDMGKMHKKKRPLTDERGLTQPKKSKSRGGWTREFPSEERSFSTPKKSKSRGGWTRELPSEERSFTTPKKSKSRGGWTMEHPAEERDFNTPVKFNSRGGWMTEHPGDFSSSKSNRNSWMSAGTAYARSTNMHASGSGSRTPGWSSQSSKAWKGQHSEASNSAFQHRYSSSRYGNSNDDGYRSNNSASRFGNSNDDGYRRNHWW